MCNQWRSEKCKDKLTSASIKLCLTAKPRLSSLVSPPSASPGMLAYRFLVRRYQLLIQRVDHNLSSSEQRCSSPVCFMMQHSKCAKFAAYNTSLFFFLFIHFSDLLFYMFCLTIWGFDLVYIHFLKANSFCRSETGETTGWSHRASQSQSGAVSGWEVPLACRWGSDAVFQSKETLWKWQQGKRGTGTMLQQARMTPEQVQG